MRRALRHLFAILSALSLLLCVATCVLWVRSPWISDGVDWQTPTSMFEASSNSGRLSLYHLTPDSFFVGNDKPGWSLYHASAFEPRTWTGQGLQFNHHLLGFWLQIRRGGTGHTVPNTTTAWPTEWELGLPHAAVVLLTAAASVLALRSAQGARHRAGHCPTCGYDLRATPERCPECGTVPASSAGAGSAAV